MFTGIVEEIGRVIAVESIGAGIRVHIEAVQYSKELNINDSISVNGVCQTVVWKDNTTFKVEAVEETLKKTSLGSLVQHSEVNLELPMRLNERLGGHLVAGHVDTAGTIVSIVNRENSWMVSVGYPHRFSKYLIHTGSITIDGVSLTVAELDSGRFTVSIIPHTMETTIFKNYKVGSIVNIEFDMVGKYIEQVVMRDSREEMTSMRFHEKELREQGF